MDKHLHTLKRSVRRASVPKLRCPWFILRPGTVCGLHGHYNNVVLSASLKTGCELNPVTEDKQETFTFSLYPF